jgi:hypothetical protein
LDITGIRLNPEGVLQDDAEKSYNRLCGLLLNYFDPDQIRFEENKTTFPVGDITIRRSDKYSWFYFNFNYDEKTSQIIDKIISQLDDLIRFDQIEFLFSSGVDLGYLVKSSREMGLNIVSYDLKQKNVDIEVISEIKEFDTVRFSGMGEKSSVTYRNEKSYFAAGFYDRINPKSVAGFFKFLQKKT